MSEPVYCYGEGRLPLYLAHLEHGLRLPLHPFIKEVHAALGVSPFHFYPNAVGVLVAFIIICYRVGVQLSLRLLGHLIGVGLAEKDPHYFFHYRGEFHLVFNSLELDEDWRRRFMWVYSGDSVFTCSSWPEVNEDTLRPVTLSDSEMIDLEKVRSYVRPRESDALFDDMSLQTVGISMILSSTGFQARMNHFPLLAENRKRNIGIEGTSSTARPYKKLRSAFSAEEVVGLMPQATKIVSELRGRISIKRRRPIGPVGSPNDTGVSSLQNLAILMGA